MIWQRWFLLVQFYESSSSYFWTVTLFIILRFSPPSIRQTVTRCLYPAPPLSSEYWWVRSYAPRSKTDASLWAVNERWRNMKNSSWWWNNKVYLHGRKWRTIGKVPLNILFMVNIFGNTHTELSDAKAHVVNKILIFSPSKMVLTFLWNNER